MENNDLVEMFNSKEFGEYAMKHKSSSSSSNDLFKGWVPVSERLPDQYPVLAAFKSGRIIISDGIERIGGDLSAWIQPQGRGRFVTNPTHWMPMPEPPESL